MYDEIKDTSDPYWKFMLLIRSHLRYITMSKISGKQVADMDSNLTELMNLRLDLTRCNVLNVNPTDAKKEKKTKKYDPPVIYKACSSLILHISIH